VRCEIFDPVVGPAFDVQGDDGLLFSNRDSGVWIMTGVSIDWHGISPVIVDLLGEGGPHGWLVVSPWVPGADKLRSDLDALLGAPTAHRDLIAYEFIAAAATFAEILKVRERRGGWASGEWLLATFPAKHQPIIDRTKTDVLGGFPDGVLIANSRHIGCGLAVSEHQQSLLIASTQQVSGVSLQRLVSTVHAT